MKLILIGIISGIVTGMGMGGGSILILILTAFMGVNQHTAQATNLIFFIPTSISAIYVYFKNKNVDMPIIDLIYDIIFNGKNPKLLTEFLIEKDWGIYGLLLFERFSNIS